MSSNSYFNIVYDTIFSYYTVRQARVYSFKVAFLYRFIQIAIIGYIIGYKHINILKIEINHQLFITKNEHIQDIV